MGFFTNDRKGDSLKRYSVGKSTFRFLLATAEAHERVRVFCGLTASFIENW